MQRHAPTLLVHQQSATYQQRRMILQKLASRGFVPRTLDGTEQTTPEWRRLFIAARMELPRKDGYHLAWPTVADFLKGMSQAQAHMLIAYFFED